jgi:hypothetical protein
VAVYQRVYGKSARTLLDKMDGWMDGYIYTGYIYMLWNGDCACCVMEKNGDVTNCSYLAEKN